MCSQPCKCVMHKTSFRRQETLTSKLQVSVRVAQGVLRYLGSPVQYLDCAEPTSDTPQTPSVLADMLTKDVKWKILPQPQCCEWSPAVVVVLYKAQVIESIRLIQLQQTNWHSQFGWSGTNLGSNV